MANPQISMLEVNSAENRAKPPENGANPPENRANPAENGANPTENGANPTENGANPPENRANPAENGANPVASRDNSVESCAEKSAPLLRGPMRKIFERSPRSSFSRSSINSLRRRVANSQIIIARKKR